MSLAVNTFEDLIHVIETRPKWRRKLVRVLFPEIDIPKALKELAEAQKRTEEAIHQLTKRVGMLEVKVDNLEIRMDRMESKMDRMNGTLGQLKGLTYERTVFDKSVSIFGRFLRKGHDARSKVGDCLQDAEDNGQITELEHDQVLACDLLWGGKSKKTGEDIILVLEVSWWIESHDIQRAVERAKVLRQIKLNALPAIVGVEWSQEMKAYAAEQNAVLVTNTRLEKASWLSAIEQLS
ncbi:MAG: hypothetical protein B6242_01695 [Anaerolineaceae bacterium 4572_78]|nr:MAG: hypothetical protein B6242_01695 [Anaerolineaceae bacterium 4572_78]